MLCQRAVLMLVTPFKKESAMIFEDGWNGLDLFSLRTAQAITTVFKNVKNKLILMITCDRRKSYKAEQL